MAKKKILKIPDPVLRKVSEPVTIINSEVKKLMNDINKLNEQKSYYSSEIDKDKKELKMIQTDTGLEKYAREKLYMKKDNEDIFIIQFDTISE